MLKLMYITNNPEVAKIADETGVDRVWIDLESKGKELRQFRRKIGMVFQSFNLVNKTSVINNVLSAKVADMSVFRTLFGLYSKEDKLQALESLDKVGILDKAFSRADMLSGGQMQRVALARTLTQDPEIILADEPVASLDPIMADVVMEDFCRINREMNITVIINIHHVDLALQYANRVVGINSGRIVYDGPTKDVNKDILRQIYGRDLNEDDVMKEKVDA